MLPTYDHKNSKSSPKTINICILDAQTALSTSLTSCFVFFNLTICSLTTMYRAYEHNDYPVVAFVVSIYASYFVCDMCLAVYNRLPRCEKSAKKELLRFTLWGLPSAMLFGFAYEFGTFMMNVVPVMLIYCISAITSLHLFYVYYILDRDPNGLCGQCFPSPNNQKTNNLDNV